MKSAAAELARLRVRGGLLTALSPAELRRMNKDLLVQSQEIPKVDETGVDLARIVSNTTAEMDLETKESFALDQQKVADFERSVEGLKKRQQDLFDLETAKVKKFADEWDNGYVRHTVSRHRGLAHHPCTHASTVAVLAGPD